MERQHWEKMGKFCSLVVDDLLWWGRQKHGGDWSKAREERVDTEGVSSHGSPGVRRAQPWAPEAQRERPRQSQM